MDNALYDWQVMMSATRNWLAGVDPYGPVATFAGPLRPAGQFSYPPSALMVNAPLALLPWLLSGLLMLLLSIVGFEYWVRRTSGRTGLPWLLLWLPFTHGLWLGQTTLLVLVGVVLAELAYRDKRDLWAGLLLALTLIKPQTALLPVAWLLLLALREQRWRTLLAFGLPSLLLWGGVALISGPDIYRLWLVGISNYAPDVPRRPLIYLPFGPLLLLLAGLLWWRYGRRDIFGTLLLISILIYPPVLSYMTISLAFVVIRWRPSWPWYPLALSWCIPLLVTIDRTPQALGALTQAVAITGLLAGVLPTLRRNKTEPTLALDT